MAEVKFVKWTKRCKCKWFRLQISVIFGCHMHEHIEMYRMYCSRLQFSWVRLATFSFMPMQYKTVGFHKYEHKTRRKRTKQTADRYWTEIELFNVLYSHGCIIHIETKLYRYYTCTQQFIFCRFSNSNISLDRFAQNYNSDCQ